MVENHGDEFTLVETSTDGILKEENSKQVLDSYALVHICKDEAMFDTMWTREQFDEINVGIKQKMKIEGVESVRFKLHDGSVKTALNVKYVPSGIANILSLGVLMSRGYRYVGRKNNCKVYKGYRLVLQGRKNVKNIVTWMEIIY